MENENIIEKENGNNNDNEKGYEENVNVTFAKPKEVPTLITVGT